jgi:hypothetical protein
MADGQHGPRPSRQHGRGRRRLHKKAAKFAPGRCEAVRTGEIQAPGPTETSDSCGAASAVIAARPAAATSRSPRQPLAAARRSRRAMSPASAVSSPPDGTEIMRRIVPGDGEMQAVCRSASIRTIWRFRVPGRFPAGFPDCPATNRPAASRSIAVVATLKTPSGRKRSLYVLVMTESRKNVRSGKHCEAPGLGGSSMDQSCGVASIRLHSRS